MVFASKSFLLSLLLAGAAVASPLNARAGNRFRRSKPTSIDRSAAELIGYSDAWSGAVLNSTGVTAAKGTFVIPTPKAPSGGSRNTEYCGAAWVGIDGLTNFCANGGLMQSGVFWCVQDGQTSFEAWYEYFPEPSTAFNINVSPGDSITVTIEATSSTSGTATLVDNTTGESVSHTWTSESPGLCEVTADWIVEDFESDGGEVPFANFGSVTFTDNSAVIGGETITDISDVLLIDLVLDNAIASSASFSGNDIILTYE